MNWKPWVLGLIALAIFDTALVLGVKAYWRHRAVPSVDQTSQVEAATLQPSRGVPAAPNRSQEACVNGATWLYDDQAQRWNKTGLACQVRSDVIRYPPRSHRGK